MDTTGDAVDKITYRIEEIGALDYIENLQTSDNHSIQKTAVEIIENFFPPEDAIDETELMPAATNEGFTFGTQSAGAQISL